MIKTYVSYYADGDLFKGRELLSDKKGLEYGNWIRSGNALKIGDRWIRTNKELLIFIHDDIMKTLEEVTK